MYVEVEPINWSMERLNFLMLLIGCIDISKIYVGLKLTHTSSGVTCAITYFYFLTKHSTHRVSSIGKKFWNFRLNLSAFVRGC